MRWTAILLLILACPPGCAREVRQIGLADLFEVGFSGIGDKGHLFSVPDFPPGMDPQEAADVALIYLRNEPSALDSPDERRRPLDPRGRDYWAAAVARIKGVDFDLMISEPDEQRDRRIVALIKELEQRKGNCPRRGDKDASRSSATRVTLPDVLLPTRPYAASRRRRRQTIATASIAAYSAKVQYRTWTIRPV